MKVKYKLYAIYVPLLVTLLLVAGTILYLSRSSTTEESLNADRNIKLLNGPWKFSIGDNVGYSHPKFDDSEWESINLTAPPGAHDDDVGLSGFISGWSAKGHLNYSGYAWYRLKIPLDSLKLTNLAFLAPPAVDDAYQLFINGSLLNSMGDFSGAVPAVYSIRPHMTLLPEKIKREKNLTVAFRVWMSPASIGPDAGGIHIAPAIGEKKHLEKKYKFQWEQTIKGYIVEVILPVLFILLAITIFLLNRATKQPKPGKWFITALVLLALVRLNQAVYYWFQIENAHQSIFLATAILRPLMLGSWLMAWWEWFELSRPKWLPKAVTLLVLLYISTQALGLSWLSNRMIQNSYQTIVTYIRLLLLLAMLFISYIGIRKQGVKDWLLGLALLLLIIALFPQEISQLNIIPGIWFPYGVGVSRGQFFYTAFVFVMYLELIRKNSKPIFA